MKKIIICCSAALISFSFASSVCVASDFAGETGGMSVKPKKEYRTVTFDVHLHCESCVKKVKENISYEKGVKALEVSLEDQTVKVTYDASKTDETKLAAAIEKLGYEVKGKRQE